MKPLRIPGRVCRCFSQGTWQASCSWQPTPVHSLLSFRCRRKVNRLSGGFRACWMKDRTDWLYRLVRPSICFE